MTWLLGWFYVVLNSFAKEDGISYAPNFILSPYNTATVMERFQTADIRLSQFVGMNSNFITTKLIIVMGNEKTIEDDLHRLKNAYPQAQKNHTELIVMYSSEKLATKNIIQKILPSFPIVKDPFEVVRGRYQYVNNQYCYIINEQGKMLSNRCFNIDDVLKELKN